MELAFSAKDTAFRDEVRTWLAEHAPRERRPKGGSAMREFARADAELQGLSAFVVAADAAERNAAATVQVLGGMGFTFEHDANLYVKRAFLLTQLFGSVRQVLSRLVLLPGPL
jgi:alkylation response protein AidB-like acyl-CoA dehydrogenase